MIYDKLRRNSLALSLCYYYSFFTFLCYSYLYSCPYPCPYSSSFFSLLLPSRFNLLSKSYKICTYFWALLIMQVWRRPLCHNTHTTHTLHTLHIHLIYVNPMQSHLICRIVLYLACFVVFHLVSFVCGQWEIVFA